MAVKNIHFFHGFLGEPEDWNPVVKALDGSAEIHTHSLRKDFDHLGKEKSLTHWAQMKKKEISSFKEASLFVGYSLGGRLLMHLDLDPLDQVLLIGSHPGLLEGREKRQQSDQGWIEKSKNLSQSSWLTQWNSQDVFRQDIRRPQREFSAESFSSWMRILSQWSLANQSPKDQWLEEYKSQVYWCCGEKDKKFEELKKNRLQPILPQTHLLTVAQAGHGVIFDAPDEVAKLIHKVFFT